MRDLAKHLGPSVEGLELLLTAGNGNYTFTAHRKKDGSRRTVQEPSDELKTVQKAVLKRILRVQPPHQSNFAAGGKGILANAKVHVGRRWVECFDLRNAYPSIRRKTVRKHLARLLDNSELPSRWVEPVLDLVMLGNTLPERYSGYGPWAVARTALLRLRNTLPQGAPTSGAVLDLVMRPVDERLAALATAHGGRYTRYVDDITFSSPLRIPKLRFEVAKRVLTLGLELHPGKHHRWSPGSPATVTGLILRERPAVNDDLIRRVESALTSIETRAGHASAAELAQLKGRVLFVEHVEPRKGARLRKRFEALQQRTPNVS